jgi:hypothetical protein
MWYGLPLGSDHDSAIVCSQISRIIADIFLCVGLGSLATVFVSYVYK